MVVAVVMLVGRWKRWYEVIYAQVKPLRGVGEMFVIRWSALL